MKHTKKNKTEKKKGNLVLDFPKSDKYDLQSIDYNKLIRIGCHLGKESDKKNSHKRLPTLH